MPGHNTLANLTRDQKGTGFEGPVFSILDEPFTDGTSSNALGYDTGALGIDKTNGVLYINTRTGTASTTNPTWTKVGTQS